MIKLSTAPDEVDATRSFEVTHPFHPLCGQRFALVDYRHCWSEYRAFYDDAEGVLRSIPARWTSLFVPDVFVVASSGRSALRVADLVELVQLVAEVEG